MSDPLPPELDDADTDPGTVFDAELQRNATTGSDSGKKDGPRLPWGHLIFLGLYLVATLSTIWASHVHSKPYRIARLMEKADAILGSDRGLDRSEEELLDAWHRYVEVLDLDPNFVPAYRRLESIRWRFQERHRPIPKDAEAAYRLAASESTLGRKKTGLFADMPEDAETRFGLSDLKTRLLTRLVWTAVGAGVILIWAGLSYLREREAYRERLQKAKATSDRGSALY